MVIEAQSPERGPGRDSGVADKVATSPDGIAPIPRETKSKGGRPLAKDADKALMRTQPWQAEGMSRASWYRRQAEKREAGNE